MSRPLALASRGENDELVALGWVAVARGADSNGSNFGTVEKEAQSFPNPREPEGK